ncbi:MAG: hypothetical protein ABIG11_00745 [bacterium]
MNTKAYRAFDYSAFTITGSTNSPHWCGDLEQVKCKDLWGIKQFSKPNFNDISYRDFLISLNISSNTVNVKSIYGDFNGGQVSQEYTANIIASSPDVIVYVYQNPTSNKVFTYALQRVHKKLVMNGIQLGGASLEVAASTFDCE